MIKKVIAGILILMVLALLGGLCFLFVNLVVTQSSVAYSELNPPLDTSSVAAWEAQRATSLDVLQQEQYGLIPTTTVDWQIEKTILDDDVLNGTAQYELWKLESPSEDFALHIVGLFPASDEPMPVVVASNFCPHHVRYDYDIPLPMNYPSMCETEGFLSGAMGSVFGEFLITYPVEQFVEHNVVLANVFLSEGVPDSAAHYKERLDLVAQVTDTDVDGVLAAWAWELAEVARVFDADERIDASKSAVYGHSRDGKAALLAGAFSEHVDLVLSHQSGKGGTSPWQDEVGESIEAITNTYGYWFTPSFTNFIDRETELTVDQHHLVAANAPKPVLISAAWWDKWGDPAGSMQSVLNATPVYELYGATGYNDGTLSNFNPEAELSYFIRPWTHGVRASDWDAFFAFMSHHFELE